MLALSLVLSAFLVALNPVSAQLPIGDPDDFPEPGMYFPWVPNGEMLGETGPHYGSVTVQSTPPELFAMRLAAISSAPAVDLYFYVGLGDSDAGYADPIVVANVQPYASVTLSAADLEIDAPGASVMVRGEYTDEDYADRFGPAMLAGSVKITADTPNQAAQTNADHITIAGYSGMTEWEIDPFEDDQHILPIVQTNSGWRTQLRIASFADDSDPNPGTAYTVTIYEAGGQGAAGTSSGEFTGTLRAGEVAHIDIMDAPGIDEGFVGVAYITANAPLGAVAERYKAETNMLMHNVSRPVEQWFPDFRRLPNGEGYSEEVSLEPFMGSPFDRTSAVAPLIFQNYNFWNTGISVANLSEQLNTVTITYFSPGGDQVGSEQLNIPPRGMEFVFTPGTQDLGLNDGFVGSALITGTQELHAAIDQVKYFGEGDEVGDAMSYVTEPPMPFGEMAYAVGLPNEDEASFLNGYYGPPLPIVIPLVQKGNPNTGTGDTSGIQLFNADAEYSAYAEVQFLDPTGNPVAPTLNVEIELELSPHQGYTLYTHNYSEMPAGFQGSAVIFAEGSLSAVSNNVNYAVQYDGAVAYTGVRPGMSEFWYWWWYEERD